MRNRRLLAVALLMIASASEAQKPLAGNFVFNTVEPCRAVDSRQSGGGALQKGETRGFDIVGGADLTLQGGSAFTGCGIPGFDKGGSRAQAIAVRITMVEPLGDGELRVWGADLRMPEIPTLSFGPGSKGQTLGTVVPVRQDLEGQDIQIQATETADVLVDVVGYYAALRADDLLSERAEGYKPSASGDKAAGTRGTDETITGNLYVLGAAGIGTTTPNAQLEVAGVSGPTGVPKIAFRNKIAAVGAAAAVQFGAGGGTLSSSNVPSDILAYVSQVNPMKGALAIRTNRGASIQEAMRIDQNGRVGIGTTAPAGKLDVNGDIFARGQVLLADGTAALPSFAWAGDNDTGIFHPPGDSNAFAFTTASGERMRIDAAGKVGIGTTTPNHQLRIVGGPQWTSSPWSGAVELEKNAAIAWRANTATNRFGIGESDGGLYFFRTVSDPGTTASPPVYDMQINDAGNVGIGIGPAAKLHVRQVSNTSEGGIRLQREAPLTDYWEVVGDNHFNFMFNGVHKGYVSYLDGNFHVFPDRRLQKDIEHLGPVLSGVMKLRPTWYHFKDSPAEASKSLGFIAQEVEAVFPELVSEKGGLKSMAYDNFAVLAVKAIQEQQTQIDAGDRRIADLEARLSALEVLVTSQAKR